jgi:hypothetical protein
MAPKKRKTLPKDFDEQLKTSKLDALKAVFDACEIDARGGVGKQTALAFDACPDALARWLVQRGADLGATDTWGNTPLHARTRSWRGKIKVLLELGADVNANRASIGTPLHAAADGKHADKAKLLLAHGARVDARNRDGLTPLELALRGCSNAELDRMPELVTLLLEAGAERSPKAAGFVAAIGKQFELHRKSFNRKHVAAASAALEYLYKTFDVTPAEPRREHDGVQPIAVRTKTWQKQHAELWELLVPSRGPAKTVQGEVIRVTGRISDEWERNGGGNWDRDYAAMAKSLADYVQRGAALAASEVSEIKETVRALRERDGEGNDRLAELAVAWVLKNPEPLALDPPAYTR